MRFPGMPATQTPHIALSQQGLALQKEALDAKKKNDRWNMMLGVGQMGLGFGGLLNESALGTGNLAARREESKLRASEGEQERALRMLLQGKQIGATKANLATSTEAQKALQASRFGQEKEMFGLEDISRFKEMGLTFGHQEGLQEKRLGSVASEGAANRASRENLTEMDIEAAALRQASAAASAMDLQGLSQSFRAGESELGRGFSREEAVTDRAHELQVEDIRSERAYGNVGRNAVVEQAAQMKAEQIQQAIAQKLMTPEEGSFALQQLINAPLSPLPPGVQAGVDAGPLSELIAPEMNEANLANLFRGTTQEQRASEILRAVTQTHRAGGAGQFTALGALLNAKLRESGETMPDFENVWPTDPAAFGRNSPGAPAAPMPFGGMFTSPREARPTPAYDAEVGAWAQQQAADNAMKIELLEYVTGQREIPPEGLPPEMIELMNSFIGE